MQRMGIVVIGAVTAASLGVIAGVQAQRSAPSTSAIAGSPRLDVASAAVSLTPSVWALDDSTAPYSAVGGSPVR